MQLLLSLPDVQLTLLSEIRVSIPPFFPLPSSYPGSLNPTLPKTKEPIGFYGVCCCAGLLDGGCGCMQLLLVLPAVQLTLLSEVRVGEGYVWYLLLCWHK
jgi:hypothetical protein